MKFWIFWILMRMMSAMFTLNGQIAEMSSENLSDNQLLVLAELRYRNQSGIEDEFEDTEPTNKRRRITKGAPAKPKWEKEDKLQGLAPFPAGD